MLSNIEVSRKDAEGAKISENFFFAKDSQMRHIGGYMKRNMMVIMMMFYMGVGLSCSSCHAGEKQPIIKYPLKTMEKQTVIPAKFADEQVMNFLGAERLEVVRNAENIEAYQVDWSKSFAKSTVSVQGYPVIAKGRNLVSDQIAMLKRLIASEKSYEFQWSKRTRVRPSYMLRVIRGTDELDIAIDFNSSQWFFSYRGNIVEEDISEGSAMPVLKKLVDSLFKHEK